MAVESNIYLALVLPFGIVLGLALVMYEDGVPFSLLNKIRCKMGNHKFKTTFRRTAKYYCQSCKKPRKHPELKVIEGGNKMKYGKYTF